MLQADLPRPSLTRARWTKILHWSRVFAIARRAFIDANRLASRRHETFSEDGQLLEPRQEHSQLDDVVSEAVEQAFESLPRSYREAIELTKLVGLSVTEAAQVLGTTDLAVKLRVHRGYKLLRGQLEKYDRRG
jgi:RNA polymerase sigma-70 factor (ECF subfamily)